MPKIPLDTTVEAEYKDGFILSETELDDTSPYDENANIFHAIVNKRPEAEHGDLVRFSCFWKDHRYDINWTELPQECEPVRLRHGFNTRSVDGAVMESGFSGVDFGFKQNDAHEVLELR